MSPAGSKVSISQYSKAYAVGDVHGCIKTLRAVLDQIQFQGTEPLFLLGDYINKGPSSRETLDYIIELHGSFPCVYPLPGNHEFLLLDYLTKPRVARSRPLIYSRLEEAGEFENLSTALCSKYINFIKALPLYYETEKYLLVHAGFSFRSREPFLNTRAMTTIRRFGYDAAKAGDKKVIHGHYPKTLRVINSAIKNGKPVIPLDNGCVYNEERANMGRLCCLELHEMKLHTVERLD